MEKCPSCLIGKRVRLFSNNEQLFGRKLVFISYLAITRVYKATWVPWLDHFDKLTCSMNTHSGNLSGHVVRSNIEVTRRSSTLPKNFGCVIEQRYISSSLTQSIEFKEAFKSKASLFGTLFRPRKRRQKKTYKAETSTHDNCSSEHAKELNFQDGRVINGRIKELILLLTPTHEYYPDSNYVFTFILCSRLFVQPVHVLQEIADTVEEAVSQNQEHETGIVRNLMLMLIDWSESFPLDFNNKAMMKQFGRCSTICTTVDPALTASVTMITEYLVKTFKDFLEYVQLSKEYRIQCDEEEKQLSDVCRDPVVFAEQLTILEIEKLSKVTAEQLIERFIGPDLTCSQLDLATSSVPCLGLYVAWFNRLSYLIATEITMCALKRNRVKLINFFIEVGKCCFKKGNYNSLMAIIVGLSMNAVARMKKTWMKSNLNGFKKLEQEMSPDTNFHRYREALRNRMKKHGKDCIIPVFSILLKDIYFLNEGIKIHLPNDVINFEKFWQLSKQIKDTVSIKNRKCTYSRNEDVISYLNDTPVCNDEGLYKSSFEVEPPGSHFERDRYKSVRIKVGNR